MTPTPEQIEAEAQSIAAHYYGTLMWPHAADFVKAMLRDHAEARLTRDLPRAPMTYE